MDNISTDMLFVVLGILIFISAYFSGSETGMMSINRYRLKHLEKQNHRGAKRVSKLLAKPDKLIGLILIGNNLVNIFATLITGIIAQRLYGDAGVFYSGLLLTLVILIFAEIISKSFNLYSLKLFCFFTESIHLLVTDFKNFLKKILFSKFISLNLLFEKELSDLNFI